MSTIKLYRHALSGHSHRVQLFLSVLGLDADIIDVDLGSGEHKKSAFLQKNLFGQLPKAVETVLGKPTSVYWYDEAGSFTLNYAPHPSFPFAKFQAHFKDGKLNTIELYDD